MHNAGDVWPAFPTPDEVIVRVILYSHSKDRAHVNTIAGLLRDTTTKSVRHR